MIQVHILFIMEKYMVREISFSVPSEHTIKRGNGSAQAYICEVQLNRRCPTSGALLIISVFLNKILLNHQV